jgi:chromosome segregation ATPase
VTQSRKKTPYIFLILTVVLALGLGYGLFKVRKERNALLERADQLDNKVALLQRKYAEEKARTNQLMRTKATLEGENRAVHGEIEKLKEENKILAEKEERLEQKMQQCETKIAALSEKYSKVKTEYTALKRKHAETVTEYDRKVRDLIAEKEALNSELKLTGQMLGRCENHNASLCEIANELVDQYEDKGVLGAIFQKEPLLQFKKVEIEKMAQEYRDKIDKKKLEKNGE